MTNVVSINVKLERKMERLIASMPQTAVARAARQLERDQKKTVEPATEVLE